ncbi:Cytochrome c6, chloroplastic [Quillaja saponaria]|uniref:Cytochrome c-553 n=1 Tax=Quillaja saponaria TaxID=32244 RepID=A0AAD7L1E9_QUISA|nr:Cytochrome c6, chloroplastic [Quillaja saponaria]
MQLLSVTSGYGGSNLSIKGNLKVEENMIAQTQWEVKFIKSLAPPLMAAVVALSPICNTPIATGQTIDIQRGSTLFGQACIGCHVGGGNITQPGATLYEKDLQRNGVDTEEEIYRVTYYGKGRMPGFGKECMPRGQCTFGARLEAEDIKLLASFVKLQAEQGWPSIETQGD